MGTTNFSALATDAGAVASGEQADAIADIAAITGGQSPTEAEHNEVVAALNDALAALREFGIIAAS